MTSQDVLLKLLRIALGKEPPASFPEGVDWHAVHALSAKQNVAGLACEGILQCPDVMIDEDLRYMWMGYGMVTETTFNRQWSMACRLADIWSQKGLSVYALKGLAIAQYYPNPVTRACADVDVYVCGSDSGKLTDETWRMSNDAIRELGVKVETGDYRHSVFTYNNVKVENHRICASSVKGKKKARQLDVYMKSLIAEMQGEDRAFINGSKLQCPPPLFNLVFFMQHAYSHFLSGNITLRNLCDWGVLAEAYRDRGSQLWDAYDEVCVRYGLKKFSDALTRLLALVCGIDAEWIAHDGNQHECDNLLLMDCLNTRSGEVTFENRFKTHLQIAKNQVRGRWKYQYFSERPMFIELAASVWGVLTSRIDE